jgi:hypothetical protein
MYAPLAAAVGASKYLQMIANIQKTNSTLAYLCCVHHQGYQSGAADTFVAYTNVVCVPWLARQRFMLLQQLRPHWHTRDDAQGG